jgi:putative transposase
LERYHRRSIRLKGYDYSQPGYYFVTICTRERECHLGKVANSIMISNDIGILAEKMWFELPREFPMIEIDQFTIMPNHLHGIIRIFKENQNEAKNRGLMNQTPTQNHVNKEWIMMKKSSTVLGKIIRYFKAKSVLAIRNKSDISFYWQRNYYERIIRDRNELFSIRKYIKGNPAQWLMDEENPINGKRT